MTLKRKSGLPPRDELYALMHDAKMEGWSLEHLFHPVRKWRFDIANVERKLAIEVDGGVFVGGRHTRGVGHTSDCEKMNEATLLGWRVLRVTPQQINNGQAMDWVLDLAS